MANDNSKYFYAPFLVSNSRFANSEIEEILNLVRNTLIIKLIMRGISYPDCIRIVCTAERQSAFAFLIPRQQLGIGHEVTSLSFIMTGLYHEQLIIERSDPQMQD